MAENVTTSNYEQLEHSGNAETKRGYGFLTSSQIALLIIIGALAVTIVTMTIRASIQSSRNASTFQTSSFLTTNLANIQRETLLLSVETERLISDPGYDMDNLELRRALLGNQLRIHFVQAESEADTRENLASYLMALYEFDLVLSELSNAGVNADSSLADRMHLILPKLDLELKKLYDREEQSFFSVFRRSLLIQHNSERLLLIASGVISILGGVVLVSLGRTVRALRAETNERRIKEEEAQRLANESTTLAEIGRIMGSSLDVEEVYEAFAERVRDLIPSERIMIVTIDHDNQTFTRTYISGDDIPERIQGDVAPLEGTMTGRVAESRTTLLLNLDSEEAVEAQCPSLINEFRTGLRSFLTIPMFSKGEVTSVFHLRSALLHGFQPGHVALSERIADQIAGAVVNAQLYSERRRLQEQIIQVQKMEAVGQLAGGVAHDFNNLLTPILGYSQMELQKCQEGTSLYSHISEIYEAAERAAGLVHQLLAFSRKQVIEPKVINVNEMILRLEKMLRRLIGEHMELETSLAPDLGLIKADPTQIDQLIINLVVNARDAVPDGGKIVVSTINANDDTVKERTASAGQRWLCISVSDNGTGMSEEVKARIFEPFFTTKEVGQGTGLGLATCYGIITQNGGYIEVESELGRGTTFHMYLPRVDDAIATARDEEDLYVMPCGTETILLVEDERVVRTFASEILREQGYTVLEAANGQEALEVVAREANYGISLLLTDVVMPRMGGKDLADRLTADHPDTKVIFASGYPDSAISNQGVLDEGTVFLQKPLTPVALVTKVREVLDQE